MSVAADAAATQKLDAILTAAARRLDFNGSVIVAHKGRILLRKAYGYADIARRVPNRPNTRFRISSLTSTINGVAVLQLAKRGQLSLQGPVCPYVPRCPATWRPMTIQMVLDGRTGLAGTHPTTHSHKQQLSYRADG